MRPSEVAAWPAWELRLLDHFLAREPSAEDRTEIALARLTHLFASVHRGKNSPVPRLADFLPYLKAWPEPDEGGRYNETDREVLKELM